ncbi:MAG: SAM-dependent DNA methyltransferase [Lysobacter sp.]|nr:SAM-dependent DNA methyltransferase [Lysobacter sp.]
MTAAAHRKAIVKLLQASAYRHQLWTVFGDFVELAALAIANAVDKRQFAVREARYLQIIQRYDPEEARRFPAMLAELVSALELDPADQLGAIFGELELGNAARGQFFTPPELCRLMARLSIDPEDMREKIARRGYITVQEPAAGAGAMIIAMATELQAAGFSYQQHMHVTAIDVDSRAVHMAYVQLSLLHVPAVVILGNTLAVEEREHWYTPAHILGAWEYRLRDRTPVPTPEPEVLTPEAGLLAPAALPLAQLDLFAAEAA